MSLNARKVVKELAIAVGAVAVVFTVTLALTTFVTTDVSNVYIVAVMIAAWRGGLLAGLSSTLLSVAVATFFFLPPIYTFSLTAEGLVRLAIFSLAAIVISYLSASRERALADEQAARSDAESANRIKDEFVAIVSHELRTPLTTIKALARLLRRTDPTEDKRREYLETISVECDRQIDLVLNLLDLSRIEGGVYRLHVEEVSVKDVVLSCVKSEMASAKKRKHKLEVLHIDPDIPEVAADSHALRRVVRNLIENSIKYTPEGGLIQVSARSNGDFSTISVSDNGRGILSGELPRLFDKFHRGSPAASSSGSGNRREQEILDDVEISGVGLGLFLAKNVIDRLGGSITVDSDVGCGSTFTLHLPVWDRHKRE